MQQLVAELTHPTVLSDRALRHLARLKDAHRDALHETAREPTREELARRSGLSREQVDDLLAADGGVGTFGELLADPLAEGEYERVLDAVDGAELRALLAALSERERGVLAARYGLAGERRTLSELAAELGVSAERVRQIERRALAKLEAAAGGEPAA
jgi:RNA polymerase primary sigma factor